MFVRSLLQRLHPNMPANPRVAAIGLGSAVLIALAIPFVAGVIATYQMKIRKDRGIVRERFEATLREFEKFGLDHDRFPALSDTDFWARVPGDVCGLTGEYSVLGDGHPIHRLPKVVVAIVQRLPAGQSRSLDVAQFEQGGTIGDVLGDSEELGLAVGLTGGEVYMLRDDMPARELRALLTRNTAVVADFERTLAIYSLR